jgi:tetratricopeptide (TPR) repeat protein
MLTLVIPLRDIIINPSKKIDLLSMPETEAISLIKESYGFLSKFVEVTIREGFAIIEVKEEKREHKNKAQGLYDIAVNEARKANYKKAIKTFKEVLDYYPNHVDARRNMAMAYLESGDIIKAKQHLHECLLVDHKDTWTYLLLGNISKKYDKDANRAEYYYNLCLGINPNDNFILNNYAALLMEKGDYDKAEELFKKALNVDTSYPNTYLGLALLYQGQKDLKSAIQALNNLFSHAKSDDIRNLPVFQEARSLYLSLCKDLAEESHDYYMSVVSQKKAELEAITGYPIQIVEDNSLQDIFAISQMAWRHNRSEHTIRYRDIHKDITPHLIAHELEHIKLETDARIVNRNRHFITTSDTREFAIKSNSNHINYLKKKGYSDDSISNIINQLVQGVIAQLYNCPLDMVVEYRVNESFREIYYSQFISINNMVIRLLPILHNRDLEKVTPKHIYLASLSLNCAYAMFTDFIFKGRTDFSSSYKPLSQIFYAGKKLFDIWQNRMNKFKPGDEYEMIDDFGRILDLTGWYKWKADLVDNDTSKKHIMTEDDISERSSEIYRYCLEALKRYDNKSKEDILMTASEIGFMGMQGIDYVTAGKTYTLNSSPAEQFTGIQLLCMMYVGFKMVDPTLNTELNFDKEYNLALDAYKKSLH